MKGPPAGLRFVLGHGVPAEIEIEGRSMEPTLVKGVKVTVAVVDAGAAVTAGDLVVLETGDSSVLLLHRVLHVFREGPLELVIHQGDAGSSSFGVCLRESVVARVTEVAGGAIPLPTLERLSSHDRARFVRRRLAARGFALARILTSSLGVPDLPLARKCGDVYRSIAHRVTG